MLSSRARMRARFCVRKSRARFAGELQWRTCECGCAREKDFLSTN